MGEGTVCSCWRKMPLDRNDPLLTPTQPVPSGQDEARDAVIAKARILHEKFMMPGPAATEPKETPE